MRAASWRWARCVAGRAAPSDFWARWGALGRRGRGRLGRAVSWFGRAAGGASDLRLSAGALLAGVRVASAGDAAAIGSVSCRPSPAGRRRSSGRREGLAVHGAPLAAGPLLAGRSCGLGQRAAARHRVPGVGAGSGRASWVRARARADAGGPAAARPRATVHYSSRSASPMRTGSVRWRSTPGPRAPPRTLSAVSEWTRHASGVLAPARSALNGRAAALGERIDGTDRRALAAAGRGADRARGFL